MGHINPSSHSLGISSSIQIFSFTFHSLPISLFSSVLKSSTFRPSGPGALLLFSFGLNTSSPLMLVVVCPHICLLLLISVSVILPYPPSLSIIDLGNITSVSLTHQYYLSVFLLPCSCNLRTCLGNLLSFHSLAVLYPFKLFFIIFFLFMYPFFFPLCFTIFFSCCSSKSPLYHTSVFPILHFHNLCTFLVKPSIPVISFQSSFFFHLLLFF